MKCPGCKRDGAEVLFQIPRCCHPDCRFYDRDVPITEEERIRRVLAAWMEARRKEYA